MPKNLYLSRDRRRVPVHVHPDLLHRLVETLMHHPRLSTSGVGYSEFIADAIDALEAGKWMPERATPETPDTCPADAGHTRVSVNEGYVSTTCKACGTRVVWGDVIETNHAKSVDDRPEDRLTPEEIHREVRDDGPHQQHAVDAHSAYAYDE